ncbi:MAG: 2'-5' RNA ligase family protein [Burkholderiales bacterium]|nr:2'-5' RNA ligase family protein [Burkholderiales bacterium]
MPAALRHSRPPLPRFAVAWFPKFDGMDRIEAFRAKHDPAAAFIPAHLSLVFPFPTAHSRLQVETHVQRIASKWPPIPVAFRRVRTHANEFLFLMASRGTASVAALHDKLYTRSFQPHLRREFPYEPHITLARYAEFPRLEGALAEAEDAFGGEFSAVMREVTLLSVERDGRIEPLKSISLHTA